MSKWRPVELNCTYVIPDIHGRNNELNLILKRILPLRKSDGGSDTLIFLGDYTDRRQDSHLVLDTLIKIRDKYKDQVVFLRGNHEEMFLDALKIISDSDYYLFWMNHGGAETLSGYLERANQAMDNPYLFPRQRIKDLIPKEHLDFLENDLVDYYETDEFVFVHGGCDPNVPLAEQDPEVLRWDRSLCRSVIYRYDNLELPWNKKIITGHNTALSSPIIRDKFVMLDDHHELLVMEAKSGEIFAARSGKERLVKIL